MTLPKKQVFYLLEIAPTTGPCTEPGCHRQVKAGDKVICIVTKYTSSYRPPFKKYKCKQCSAKFLKSVKTVWDAISTNRASFLQLLTARWAAEEELAQRSEKTVVKLVRKKPGHRSL